MMLSDRAGQKQSKKPTVVATRRVLLAVRDVKGGSANVIDSHELIYPEIFKVKIKSWGHLT